MLFNKKNQTIVYLTDTILRVYEGDSLLKTVALPVKKDEMRKVLRTLFQEEIASFLQKSEVLVVLGGKLLFQKAFLLSEETVGEEDKEAFFADLPIPTEELGKNVITTEHKVYLLGTNRSFISPLSMKAPMFVTDTAFSLTISPTTAFGSCVVAMMRSSES